MKRMDIIVIALVIIMAGIIAFIFYSKNSELTGNNVTADIYVDGDIYKSVPITQREQSIEVETSYGKNTIKIYNNGIEMSDADCPDQLCKGFGFIDMPGGLIVCLPHHLYVEIKADSE